MGVLQNMTLWELLKKAKAPMFTDKHFCYTSGRHGEEYINLRVLPLMRNKAILEEIAFRLLHATILQANLDVNKPITVIGPETLGASLAKTSVTEFLKRTGQDLPMRSGTLEKEVIDGVTGFKWKPGDNILLIKNTQAVWMDDTFTTGSTFERTRYFIEDFAHECFCAAAVVINRSDVTAEGISMPNFVYLEEVSATSFPSDECPFCEEKRPMILSLGHGTKFQKEQPDYAGGFIKI